jgi:aldose 1-epimerase
VIAPSGEQIEIAAGDQQAVVVEVGGGLRSYSAGGRKLVDGYGADEMSSSGRGQVLIPWPNRLQDGSYEFDGRRHQLPLNEPQHHNAIHGLVRWAAWTALRPRAAPGRDGTHPLSATGLPLLSKA